MDNMKLTDKMKITTEELTMLYWLIQDQLETIKALSFTTRQCIDTAKIGSLKTKLHDELNVRGYWELE
jgi:hypothetical protein